MVKTIIKKFHISKINVDKKKTQCYYDLGQIEYNLDALSREVEGTGPMKPSNHKCMVLIPQNDYSVR